MRRYLSLIEVLIAVSLLSCMIALLSGGLFRMFKANASLLLVQDEVLRKALVDLSIRDVIESAALPFKEAGELLGQKDRWSTLHTEKDGSELVFVYRPMIAPEPEFCNYVKARLFLSNNVLWLEKSPFWMFDNGTVLPVRMMLTDNVTSMSFEFYLPGAVEILDGMTDVGRSSSTHKGKILKEWMPSGSRMPRMIKIKILKTNGEHHEYHYTMHSNPFVFRCM